MKKIWVILLLLFSQSLLFAQNTLESNNSTVNHQLWIDLYPHFRINENLEYYGDAGFRTIMGEKSWSRFYIRPSVRYSLSPKWIIHAGLGAFYIFNHDDIDQLEIRPWQGIQFNQIKRPRFSLKHLLRIEERFSFYPSNNWANSFDLRFRYKLSGKLSPFREGTTSNWYIPFYGELFVPLKNELQEFFSNRNRIGTGVGYKFSEDFELSLVLNRQSSKMGSTEKFNVSDYAYQFKIVKTWKKRESKR